MKIENIFDTDDEVQFLYSWIFKRDKVLIDNFVFYLHYHTSVALYFVGCLLITIAMYILDPIDCIVDQAVDDVIDNFCLYHSTYTISDAMNKTADLSVHPGVPPNRISSRENFKYHNYYLWVAMILAIQASFFYIPRGLWKTWENSKVDLIINKTNDLFESEVEEEVDSAKTELAPGDKLKRLANYIQSKSHNTYYRKLLFCELFNFIIAVVQLFITNSFLGYSFSQIQNLEFLQLMQDTRPFERAANVELVFPKVTACTFYTYGPSGNVINYEALCVLPVNSLNEKVFGVIFTWLLFLIGISLLAVLYRLLFLLKPIRRLTLSNHLNSDEIITNNLSLNNLNNKHLGVGNWQLLCQVGGNWNIDSWDFTKIVMFLCEQQQ